MSDTLDLLTTEQLAEQLQTSERQVQRMRVDGSGPPFVTFGRRTVRYSATAVAEWMKQRAQTRVDEAV